MRELSHPIGGGTGDNFLISPLEKYHCKEYTDFSASFSLKTNQKIKNIYI